MQALNDVKSFRALHAGRSVLLLPNAWDAASAALFRARGAAAIATTSAGLAWACGFADGAFLPREDLLFAVRAIRRVAAETPVTVDLENGYSDKPDEVAGLIAELRSLGIVGVNLEDGKDAPELLAAKIATVKGSLAERGNDIFINARTDVFLHDLASGEAAVKETISRAQRYAQAGADCIFVPMLSDPDTLRIVAGATKLPLNILPSPRLPSLHDLYGLGVRRLSVGALLSRLAYGTARRAAEAFLRDGATDALFGADSVRSGEMNDLLASKTV